MTAEQSPDPRPYLNALYECLAGAGPAVRDGDPLLILGDLVRDSLRLAEQAGALEEWNPRLAALGTVAGGGDVESAGAAASRLFPAPVAFREAILAARSLTRDPAAACALEEARLYIAGAGVPASLSDLLTDRDAVLDAATFAGLWQEPSRLDWMLDTAAIWKRGYVASYLRQHESFNAAIDRLAEQVEDARPAVAALERLNELRRLGPAVSVAALSDFHELERLFRCPLDETTLTTALESEPVCPGCGFRPGEQPPVADLRRAQKAVGRGLGTQQARLSRRVVSLILASPLSREDEKVERFLKVVQASDLRGLATALDDPLVEFLRDLLDSPAGFDVFARVARVYPEVTRDDLDDVVREFRTALETALSAGGGRLRLRGE